MKYLFIAVMLAMVLSGCDNPVFFSDTSQAISHKIEREEYKNQTKELHRIADALEVMARSK